MTNLEKQGQTDRQTDIQADKDILVQTDIHGQTGTDRDRQGQTQTDRDRQGQTERESSDKVGIKPSKT